MNASGTLLFPNKSYNLIVSFPIIGYFSPGAICKFWRFINFKKNSKIKVVEINSQVEVDNDWKIENICCFLC